MTCNNNIDEQAIIYNDNKDVIKQIVNSIILDTEYTK